MVQTDNFSRSLIITYFWLQFLLLVGISIFVLVELRSILINNGAFKWNLKFFTIWLKTVWKMRSMYSSLLVHIFDFFTDLLVINEWYYLERGKNSVDVEHVDTNIMAFSGIGIIVLYRFVSMIAIYFSDDSYEYHDWKSALLQFFDLLLFVEIYNSHKILIESVASQNYIVVEQMTVHVHVQSS